MLGQLGVIFRKSFLVGAITVALVMGIAPEAYAAGVGDGGPNGPTPKIYQCQFVSYVDKKGGQGTVYDPVSGSGYTLTVYASFAYDNYFGGEYCWTRSHAVIYKSGNEYGGTLYMQLSNCTSQVDSVQLSFPGGQGTVNLYGHNVGAGCAVATAYLVASNGFRLPSGYASSNSGRELS